MPTNTKSVLRTAQDSINKPLMLSVSGNLHVMYDTHTAVVAGGSTNGIYTIDYPRLPSGRILVIPDLCRLNSTAMTATADLHLGHRAFVKSDGTVEAEDDNEWLDNVDTGGGAINAVLSAVTGYTGIGNVIYDAQDGLVPYVTIDTADIRINDVVRITFVYALVP